MATLTVTEETTGKGSRNFEQITVPERITVRQLICLYIDHQIEQQKELNDQTPPSFFIPSPEEQQLNEGKSKERSLGGAKTTLNAAKLKERALGAFSQNLILLLVDNQQADDLEQEVLISPRSTITFLRLSPLVGG